jgi:hypothetical protein
MKLKYIITLTIVLLCALTGKAQYYKLSDLEGAGKPKIGLRTGTSLSKLNNGNEETDFRFGFSFGGALKVPLNRYVSLQNELVFSKKGGSITYLTNLYYTGKVRYNLYYLDIPLLLKVRLGRGFYLVGGYQGSLMLDANIDYVDPYLLGFAELNESELNSWDNSLVAGFSVGGLKRSFDVRLSYGLTDVAKSSYANTFLGDARNVSIQFCFTRYFGGRR